MATYIKHHGILGQRWGVRNGPPYPLDSGSHSASERKAGWRKSLSGGDETKKKKYHTDPLVDTKNKRYTERGEQVMNNKAPYALKSATQYKSRAVYNSDGEKISRKEFQEIRKDLKKTNPEKYSELEQYESGREVIKNAIANRISPLAAAIEAMLAKKDGLTLKEFREQQDTAFLATEDMINKIIADHGNEMAERFIQEVAGGLKYRRRKSGGIFEIAPQETVKPASEMTDQELIDYNKRRGLENTYNKYTEDTSVKDRMNSITQLANSSKSAVNNANQLVNDYYDRQRKRRKNEIDLSYFSDEELRRVVNRMNMERQYRDMAPDKGSEKEQKIKTALGITGTVINTAAAAAIIYASVRSAMH